MNQNEPKILVSICNYNHSKYLAESIVSIQNQTYENLDICIVDDGSSDPDIVKEIISLYKPDKRIRAIFLSENKGKWFALNESIKSSDAILCTSHDADDISLNDRIDLQYKTLVHSNTIHNLCGFYHCWNEDDIISKKNLRYTKEQVNIMDPKLVGNLVMSGFKTSGINHYFTGEFETAGVSALFYKEIWNRGIRYHPPNLGLRVLSSEDSDFNFRVTQAFNQTSITAEKLYLYRRNTSTNKELL